ncbi:uncharacterized protein [Hoplias malabaricus]|uniref:uncharacterized protein isoform X2 n=1 Tax=Hoplias malabaricus TaxID=27720 RepID=UPI0034618C6F
MKEGVSPEDSSSEEGVSSEEWSEELDTESDDDVLNDSTLISAAVRERDGRWRKWRRMRSRELQPVHGMRKRDSSSTSPASVSIEEDSPASDSPECVSPEDSSSEEGVSSEKWSEELDTESDQDVLNDSTLKRVLELLYEEQDCLGEGGYGTLFAGIRRKTGHLVVRFSVSWRSRRSSSGRRRDSRQPATPPTWPSPLRLLCRGGSRGYLSTRLHRDGSASVGVGSRGRPPLHRSQPSLLPTGLRRTCPGRCQAASLSALAARGIRHRRSPLGNKRHLRPLQLGPEGALPFASGYRSEEDGH